MSIPVMLWACSVIIRGINSINGNTSPLFIIDGTPVDEDNFRSINPQEIASIDVLKDAAATAIYGNRGANGVVVIKTRRGEFNTPLQINYTGILSYSTLQDNDYNLMDSQQQLTLENDGQVTVDMGMPHLEPAEIPFDAPAFARHYPLDVAGRHLEIAALSMGNPHAVLQVDDIETAPVRELGPAIECHPRFPERVNAGFMQIVDPATIRVRVYERGAGETLACGSGACAAMVAGRLWERLEPRVKVVLTGGELVVSWSGSGNPVLMTGPATTVYQGRIEL